MIRSFKFFLPLFFAVLLASCNPYPNKHWSAGLPYYTPAFIVAEETSDINRILYSDYMDVLDPLTPASRSIFRELTQNVSGDNFNVKAIAIFPHDSDNWKPVWVMSAKSGLLKRASEFYSKPFTENRYRFDRTHIYKLFMTDEVILYGVELGNWLYISESSFGIEEVVRTYGGRKPAMDTDVNRLRSGQFVVNGPYLNRYISLETAVRYRPSLINAFTGAGTTYLAVTNQGGNNADEPQHTFSGSMALAPLAGRSDLVRAISSQNHNNVLDRYISQDAAAAVLMNARVSQSLPDGFAPSSEVDEWLTRNSGFYAQLTRSLGDNFGYAAFASSGFLSVGEFAYLRMLENRSEFVAVLQRLVDEEKITRESEYYLLDSGLISGAISGNFSNFDVYYLRIIGDAVAITQRPGLIQKLVSDRSRRRALYYNETYLKIRQQFPEQISGFVYAQSEELIKFVQNLLNVTHQVDAIFDLYDVASMAFRLSDNGLTLSWETNTYQIERTKQPFEERWLVSLDGTDLAGYPVLADIGGSSRNEIIVSTQGGLVVGLAADGTQVFRVRTGNAQPLGSPIVYDWYANNQMAILIGAGNKIFGWNNTGIPLPNFPIELPENLSAPILITDVTRNGLPEIIAATADRRVHVLDQRGNNIAGWPQSINASIRTRPIVETIDGRRSIFGYAENVVFGWDMNGNVRPGYPVFNNTPLRGDLVVHRNHILSGTADGSIIAIGRGDYFSDEFAMITSPPAISDSDPKIQTLQVTNSSTIMSPNISTHTINLSEEESVNETYLFAASDNGSIFAISLEGQLRFTQSLGQPIMSGHPPSIFDLNRNGRAEIMGLAGFGRLYAWELERGERFLALPTTAIKYPIFSDINGNGRIELVAGSRDGLRAWTINR